MLPSVAAFAVQFEETHPDTMKQALMKKRNDILLGYLLVLLSATGVRAESLLKRFETQRLEYPQEKIYVHTDRNYYMGGDTIWLRAHVVDAASHRPVSMSKYVYVELKAPSDSLLSRVKIKEQDGVYSGYIPLPQDLIEADYTLTAYTYFMQNAGSDYFFKENLTIGSPLSTKYTIGTRYNYDDRTGNLHILFSYLDKQTGEPAPLKNARITTADGKTAEYTSATQASITLSPKQQRASSYLYVAFDQYRKYVRIPNFADDYDVTFHPEGGYLVPESACRVAFKAIDCKGSATDISGHIEDVNGKEVARFSSLHSGMGFFTLYPQAGMKYTAVCHTPDGNEKRFSLPEVSTTATVLKVTPNGNSIGISAAGVNRDCQVVIHERGNYLLSATFDSDRKELFLRKSDLPTGVVNAVLFDSEWNPLSERLFFIDNDGGYKVSLQPDKRQYATRQRVSLSVSLDGYALPQGNYSISVTDAKIVSADTLAGIGPSLLLTSELRGHIEEPGYYFNPSNDNRLEALDALMLTQGWRRYDVPAIVRGNYAQPSYEVEIGQEVTGVIRSKWRNAPEAGAMVNVLVPKYRYGGLFEADSAGKFRCNGFDFPENTTLLLLAFNRKGERIFPNFTFDSTEASPDTPFQLPAAFSTVTNEETRQPWENFVDQQEIRYQYNGMSVTLDEVIIKGFKVRPPEDHYEAIAFRSFDYKEMEKKGATSVEEILRGIAGIRITHDGYLFYRNEPLALFVDGVLQTSKAASDEDFYTYKDQEVIETPGMPSKGNIPKLSSGHTSVAMGLGSNYESPMSIINNISFDMVRRVDFLQKSQAMMFGEGAKGGAVMITTKRGNEIESSDFRSYRAITPLGYQQKAVFYSPRYDTEAALNATMLDLRPTLYWNPCVPIDKDGKSEVSFYTSDSAGTSYDVKIEGVTDGGDMISTYGVINVK